MNRPTPHLSLAALALAAASLLVTLPARAQGTQEQQDACAPDAFKFCQATIPDIPKTEACMKAHFSQLSHRCQLAFGDVTGAPKGPPAATARGEETAPPPVAVAPREDRDEAGIDAAPDSPTSAYAAQIRGYCRDGLIDPFTCRSTLNALKGAE